jgi:hypothetical protein
MGGLLIRGPVRGARVLPVLAALLAAGCAQEPTGDVSGRAVYNDRLLPSGTVAFYDDKGRVESSLISSDGSYHIPRAPCGEVRITVQTPPVPRGKFAKFGPPSIEIPRRYAEAKESGLTYTVKPGPQTFDIKLTGPPVPADTASTGGKSVDYELQLKTKAKKW